jgi:hypothetical protein
MLGFAGLATPGEVARTSSACPVEHPQDLFLASSKQSIRIWSDIS